MNKEQLDSLFEAIDSKDAARFATFINEDGTFIFGNAPEVVGRSNIFNAVDEFFKSIKSINHTIDGSIQNETELAIYGTSEYTRHNGTKLLTPFCNIFKFKNGLIQKYQIYIDLSQLYQ